MTAYETDRKPRIRKLVQENLDRYLENKNDVTAGYGILRHVEKGWISVPGDLVGLPYEILRASSTLKPSI